MKTLRLFSISLTLFFVLGLAVQCSDDPATVALSSISGSVTYPDGAGAPLAAGGAVVTLFSTTPEVVNMQVISDANGNYSFDNLVAATYTLAAYYDTDNKNNSGRLTGLRFSIGATEVVLAAENVTQDLALVSGGQTAIPAIVANYAWDGTNSKYDQPATPAWQFDNNHSLVSFEFPYRGAQADFSGAFKQMHKFVVSFDPANLAGSSIDVEIDLASVDTRTPGGRDNRTTVDDNPPFSPTTDFMELGCIAGTFGITPDNTITPDVTPSKITTNTNRYAKFTSSAIKAYGDGYLAKGDLTFMGITKSTDLWFKTVAPLIIGTNTRTGFEGRLIIKPKADYTLTSGNIEDAPVTINISIVGSVTQ